MTRRPMLTAASDTTPRYGHSSSMASPDGRERLYRRLREAAESRGWRVVNPEDKWWWRFSDPSFKPRSLSVEVALKQDGSLAVECNIEGWQSWPGGNSGAYGGLEAHKDAIEQSAGFGSLTWEPPRSDRAKGQISWRRSRPDFTTTAGLQEALAWVLPRLIGLHDALAPWWPRSAGHPIGSTGQAGHGEDPVGQTQRSEEDEPPPPYARRATPPTEERLVDGERSAAGWTEHEDIAEALHAMAVDASPVTAAPWTLERRLRPCLGRWRIPSACRGQVRQ